MASVYPAARKALVIPVRRLPISRISFPMGTLTAKKPKGIDPMMYVNGNIPMIERYSIAYPFTCCI